MRITKPLVGWLAFASLLVAILSMLYWLRFMVEPWLKGATLCQLRAPGTEDVARQLAASGSAGANHILEGYVTHATEPYQMWTGIEGFLQSLGYGRVPQSDSLRNVAAAAFLDRDGRVLAAYPRGLVGKAFPFSRPIADMDYSSMGETWYERAYQHYPYWTGEFSAAARKLAPKVGDILLTGVEDPNGRTVGVLATAVRSDRAVMTMPSGQPVPDPADVRWALDLAILSLIAWVLLLPTWTAMDAAWRGMRPFAWGTLVFLTNLVGLAGYMVARLPGPGECPNCGEMVLSKYVRCPACGVTVLGTCPVCKTKMKPGWQYCPVCHGAAAPVSEPAQSRPIPEATSTSSSGQASLRISVVDAESGMPIPNVRVSVTGPSAMQGLTNSAGVFEARRLRSGDYEIGASKPGCEPADAEMQVESAADEQVQLRLRTLPGRIIGRVVDRGTFQPIAGAQVHIDSSRLDRSAQTGVDGGFVLADIPPGPYTVVAEATGFARQAKLAEVAPGQQSPLDFGLERQNEHQ